MGKHIKRKKSKRQNRRPRHHHDAEGLPPWSPIKLDSDQPPELLTVEENQAEISVALGLYQSPEINLDQSYKPEMEDNGMLEASQLEEQEVQSSDAQVQELAVAVESLSIEETPEAKKARIEQAAYDAEIVAIAKSKLPFYRLNPTVEEIDAVRQAELKQDAFMNKASESRKEVQKQELDGLKNHKVLPTLKSDGSVEYLDALLKSVTPDNYTELNIAMSSVERAGLPKADVPKEPAKGVKPQVFAKAKEYTGTPVTPYQQLLADKQRKLEIEKLSTKEGNSHHEAYQKLQRNGSIDRVVTKVPLLAEAVDQAHRDQVAQHIAKPGM